MTESAYDVKGNRKLRYGRKKSVLKKEKMEWAGGGEVSFPVVTADVPPSAHWRQEPEVK